MKSAVLLGIFAIALTSATDVGFMIARDPNLLLPEFRVQASGTCRTFYVSLRPP